jgi:hypothetical protein
MSTVSVYWSLVIDMKCQRSLRSHDGLNVSSVGRGLRGLSVGGRRDWTLGFLHGSLSHRLTCQVWVRRTYFERGSRYACQSDWYRLLS